ncbi:MAG: hypothetical protein IKI42_04715 [Clostridia bacterium]|nr:hypothetical protein [Clostridia bacterium]
MLSKRERFEKAVPVWAQGRNREMNLSLVFTLPVGFRQGRKYGLTLAASSAYMAFCGNEFVSTGPARCGRGYYRVDRLDLGTPERDADGEVRIIVAGYNVNSFQYLDMPAFLCAEVTEDGKVIGCTGADSAAPGTARFEASVYTQRIQKIQRYSFQRAFAEAYDMRRLPGTGDRVKLTETEAGVFLERGVPAADFSIEAPEWITCRGAAHYRPIAADQRIKNRVINEPRNDFKCFPLDELEVCTAWEAQGFEYTVSEPGIEPFAPTAVAKDSFVLIDMGREFTGMIGLECETDSLVDVYVLESETLTGGRPDGVDFYRLGDSDLIKWTLPAGRHSLLTFEPYSFRYAKLVVRGGGLKLNKFYIRRYSYGKIKKTLSPDTDPELRQIFDAAVETFRQNAVDIFMDCPSRERAVWLCDSYFTSRTEKCLTGGSRIERNFLENFLLPDHFESIPEGMLPMCYPSDHNDGVFIPTWAMWFVVELGEYFERTGDRELVDFARARVNGLIRYFEGFENEFGLLEKLQSWVFIEWSHSNDLVQDVNFPLNFLYARMLHTAADLYGDNALLVKAENLLRTASAMSFTGRFFCDNAYRRSDRLVLSGECTESCQYYAFYFGAADETTHPDLYNILVNEFGPDREAAGTYKEIAPANAFIGNYLRLDWLMRQGLYDKVRDNIRGYFGEMARKTGTLWELMRSVASCNHGFASHVAVWLADMDAAR